MSSQRLYDTDFYAWTQDQAEKLREVRDNRLDAANLAEEVADLGDSKLQATKGHLRQMLIHLLKAAYSPADRPKAGWLAEIGLHHAEALDHYSPSMHAKIDLDRLWQQALTYAGRALSDHGAPGLPSGLTCPFTLDDLLAEEFDVDAAVARLASGA
jgi:hypothetical protein